MGYSHVCGFIVAVYTSWLKVNFTDGSNDLAPVYIDLGDGDEPKDSYSRYGFIKLPHSDGFILFKGRCGR